MVTLFFLSNRTLPILSLLFHSFFPTSHLGAQNLDKMMLYKILLNGYGKYEILEELKAYLSLEEVKALTVKELENNQNLSELFKDKLKITIDKFMESSNEILQEDMVIIVKHANQDGLQIMHKLYTFLDRNKMDDESYSMLIYTKIPYRMNKSETRSLNLFVHLAKIR